MKEKHVNFIANAVGFERSIYTCIPVGLKTFRMYIDINL